uniref:Uncharacterized protein n=1 Tax=Arundo donax TaxID=35708 RepID=A0A0A9TJZ2_ARUDO
MGHEILAWVFVRLGRSVDPTFYCYYSITHRFRVELMKKPIIMFLPSAYSIFHA